MFTILGYVFVGSSVNLVNENYDEMTKRDADEMTSL